VLDREPAKWFVRVTKREKRSCGKCSAIQMPPLAPRIVEKGLASDRARKNWLHVGSVKSGPKVAAILSVVESCRRLGVPVKEYLLAVLPGMSQRKHSEAAQGPAPY
jgi:hypothetical protein